MVLFGDKTILLTLNPVISANIVDPGQTPRSAASVMFANVPVQVLQITIFTFWRPSDKNSKAINNRYLDFI